jgi:hypothetical protein
MFCYRWKGRLKVWAERFERYGLGKSLGILRFAQDDGNQSNGESNGRSRSPLGMATRKARAKEELAKSTARAKASTTSEAGFGFGGHVIDYGFEIAGLAEDLELAVGA